MNKPRGIASDAAANIYIAGYSDNKVYEINATTGLLSLLAGTGRAGTAGANNGDGDPATSANLDGPRGIWADSPTAGTIQTIAGTGTSSSIGDNGPAILATISNPQGVLVDANLNVYIADSKSIRVICVTCGTNSPLDTLLAQLGITSPVNGDIYTIAGGASKRYAGAYPTLGTNVTMSPQKLAMDGSGNLYISDGSGAAWFLDAHTDNVRLIAGNAGCDWRCW